MTLLQSRQIAELQNAVTKTVLIAEANPVVEGMRPKLDEYREEAASKKHQDLHKKILEQD